MPWGLHRRFLQCVNLVNNIVIATRPEMGCVDVYAGGQSQCGGPGAPVVAGLNSLLGQCAPASPASDDSASPSPIPGSSDSASDVTVAVPVTQPLTSASPSPMPGSSDSASDVTAAVPVPAQLDIAEIECRLTYSPVSPDLFVCRPRRGANG